MHFFLHPWFRAPYRKGPGRRACQEMELGRQAFKPRAGQKLFGCPPKINRAATKNLPASGQKLFGGRPKTFRRAAKNSPKFRRFWAEAPKRHKWGHQNFCPLPGCSLKFCLGGSNNFHLEAQKLFRTLSIICFLGHQKWK